MLQIAYFSAARDAQGATTVYDILIRGRRANRRNSITGLLVAGGGRYLQVIEGPRLAVEALYEKIIHDERHVAIAKFLSRRITRRTFGFWSMAYKRRSARGEPNSFNAVLAALTSDIADPALKHQIRYFAKAAIEGRQLELDRSGDERAREFRLGTTLAGLESELLDAEGHRMARAMASARVVSTSGLTRV